MVNESEVCCGIVNWLIKKQEQYNRESLKKQIGFFVGVESAKKIGEWLLENRVKGNNIMEKLSNYYNLDDALLEQCFIDIVDIKIPYIKAEDKEMYPDFMVHVFDYSENSSEIWAIEAKGDSIDSIKRGLYQVVTHGYACHKSFLAIPEEMNKFVEPFTDKNYGILSYSNTSNLIQELNPNILTQSKTSILNYITQYLRNYHLTKNAKDSEKKTLKISTIAFGGKESTFVLALRYYYGLPVSASYGRLGAKINDLIEIGLINKDKKATHQFLPFFKIIDSLLDGNTSADKVDDFIEKMPEKSKIGKSKALYEMGEFPMLVSNLLNLCLKQNQNVGKIIDWIRIAQSEAKRKEVTLAHVFTVGFKNDPFIAEAMWLIDKNRTTPPIFVFDSSRTRKNVCYKCRHAKSCFGSDVNITSRESFSKKQKQFFEDWKLHSPWEFFNDKKLLDEYLIDYKYPSGETVKIIKPGFLKALAHENINKTNGMLRHAGIIEKDCPSGIKSELCVRNNPEDKFNGYFYVRD